MQNVGRRDEATLKNEAQKEGETSKLKEYRVGLWIGFIRLRTGTGGALL